MFSFRLLIHQHIKIRQSHKCARRNLAKVAESSSIYNRDGDGSIPLRNPVGEAATTANTPHGGILMEPSILCKNVVQSAKNGKVGKKAWKEYIRKAIELKHRLSLKHIAIIVHSFSNAQLDRSLLYKLLEGLSESILSQLSNMVVSIPAGGNDIALYNIYSIFHGMLSSRYKNDEMLSKLTVRGVEQLKGLQAQFKSEPLPPFFFEDLAGILHAISQLKAPIGREDMDAISRLFTKLYEKDQVEARTISHRTFAIIFNVLERWSCNVLELYQVGSSYMHKQLGSMINVKDIAMIYCSLVRLGVAIQGFSGYPSNGSLKAMQAMESTIIKDDIEKESTLESEMDKEDMTLEDANIVPHNSGPCRTDAVTITNMIISRLLEPGLMTSSSDDSSESIANIVAHAAIYVEMGGEQLMEKYRIFLDRSIRWAVQTTLVDHVSMVHLMKHAIQVDSFENALLLLNSKDLDNTGLLAGPLEFAQHIANLKAISTRTRGSKLDNLLLSRAITNMIQFDKRLGMPRVTVRPKPQRKRTLRDLIEAASQKPDDVGTICVYNDLYDHFNGERAFFYAARTMMAISEFALHKAAVDLAQKLRNIMLSSSQNPCCIVDVESIAAAVTALSRFRMKNDQLLRTLEERMRPQIQNNVHPGTIVQILLGYAKLGCPDNRDISRGILVSSGVRRKTRSSKWLNTQHRYEVSFRKLVQSVTREGMMKKLNFQAALNCVFAISLSGLAQTCQLCLYRLLRRLSHLLPKVSRSATMDKQLLTSLVVLEAVFRNRSKLLLREIRKLKRTKSKGALTITDTLQIGNIVLTPMKPVPTLSGLHRQIWKKAKNKYTSVKSEVPCKNGIYYTDMVARKGIITRHIEVDGPTHFYHGTHELMSISKLKHAVLKSYGYRVVHVPYYAQANNMALPRL